MATPPFKQNGSSGKPFTQKKFDSPKYLRRNNRIRVPEVRVVDIDGRQLGVLNTREAISLAERQGLDLVEVSPNSKPPVCRILDFGKFMYEEKKKNKGTKVNPSQKIKEVKFRINIDIHDYQTKIRQAEKFLNSGFKVKVTLTFRGRELEHEDIGFNIVKRVIQDLEHIASTDAAPRLSGRNITLTLSVIPQNKRKLPASSSNTDKKE